MLPANVERTYVHNLRAPLEVPKNGRRAAARRLSLLRSVRGVKLRVLSNGSSRSSSPPVRLALGLVGALAWVGLAIVGLLVKLALFPRHRSPGAMACIWGVGFALYLWWGSKQVGLDQNRAILLGLVAGVASAFFIYVSGAGREKPPSGKPGVFLGRAAARRSRRSDSSQS